MSTTGKLAIAASIIASVTAYMAYVGASSGWQYYLTVDECYRDAADLVGQPIRVAGTVVPGSLGWDDAPARAAFKLGEGQRQLAVFSAAPLPDNLAESMQVVVEGRLDQAGRLQADQVLTRCASKYESETGSAPPRFASTDDGEQRR